MKKLCIVFVSFLLVFSWGFSQEMIWEIPEIATAKWPRQMVLTPSGKLFYSSMGADQKVWLTKLDLKHQKIEWSKKVFGGSGQTGPKALIWSESENSFYLGGSGLWDNKWQGFLVKLDSLGNIVKEIFLGQEYGESTVNEMILKNDKIFIIGHGGNGISFICCLSNSFQEIWKTEFQNQGFEKIVKCKTEIVIFGYTLPEGQNYIMKLDLSGNIIWKKNYSPILQVYDAIPSSEEFLITGKSLSGSAFLKKFDSEGNVIWEREFDLRPGFDSKGSCIFALNDGSGDLILVGNITGNWTAETFVFRIDSEGYVQWERYFHQGGTSTGIYNPKTGNIILGGGTNENIPQIIVLYQDVTPIDEEKNSVPAEFQLEQNYPNPFNVATNIRFQLTREANVSVIVYNILGNKVRNLVQNERKQTGYYTVKWSGENDAGQMLPSGTYLYHITANSFSATKKMVLMK